jgi:hypothetical protein
MAVKFFQSTISEYGRYDAGAGDKKGFKNIGDLPWVHIRIFNYIGN